MASIEDDDDRDLAGSQDGSSDNEMEDTLRDADDGGNDNEPDPDADADQDAESQSNASHASESAGVATQPNPDVEMSNTTAANSFSDPRAAFHPSVREKCLTAPTFDIVPTTAAPHSTSINAVTATADMRWVFSGGSDGYVRKFNWVDSVNSKLMLTVAQRHPFVDSVIKAGVLMTYWENMDGNTISPVYSLASHSEGLWLLSGLESGSIRLQSVRHDEGKEIALLQQHTSAVSVLSLTSDEKSLLSGSWDKRVFDWDLNTGQTRRAFGSSAGQISAVEIRPESNADAPGEPEPSQNGVAEAPAAPAPAPAAAGTEAATVNDIAATHPPAEMPNGSSQPMINGLPHAEELEPPSHTQESALPASAETTSNTDNLFLAASIDGTIRVWDRREPDAVARITSQNCPPWCMNACWSPDGNYIYAGRRNGTVEEYSLHKGLRSAERTFKFPQGSGPVTALKAMPNGRHIVCASHDILRLYDLKHEQVTRHSTVPFLIIPGHRTGTVSQLYIDQACRFMVSTSGNRGWEGNTTEVLLGYEIGVPG
ncbi:uncharacterized protein An07g04000 [Aspergillus niger]|uniref:Contig An07c0100, genomic contig n=2 Tax=Aspergillus niger TaxID=5061 RepID=A2QN09_ASPNC|nr:uncharacterized protein An07g04000 [Aspergillus niger]CAK48150.1 unnamed protein product [Aspergillus niger]